MSSYLFAQVAHAIGSTPKSLRNWMQRAQITFDSPEVRGWRRFTDLDVARLALIRCLVDAAVPIDNANAIVFALPKTVFADRSQRDDLLVWWLEPDLERPRYSGVIVPNGSTRPWWDVVAQTHCPSYPTKTFSVLSVGPVIARAMARLNEPVSSACEDI